MKASTIAIHAGENENRARYGSVCPPIFQSANYLSSGEMHYDDIHYMRLNNSPNHLLLGKKISQLEGGEATVVTASGMAAITTALLSTLKSGDHLLAQNCLYGGTYSFVTEDLKNIGIEYDFIDLNDPESWESKMRPNTKGFYCESMTNPKLQIGDLEAVARFCKAHKLVSMIDNTFASPINFNPIKWGMDIVLHSATKYLNGHSDIVGGSITGSRERIDHIMHRLNHLGGCMDAHCCFLLNRGIKTLSLRVHRQNENAMALANFLENHSLITQVVYPGLSSHPDHERAKKLFSGFGGVLGFEVAGGIQAADRLIENLNLAINAASLGGVETLITRPVTTSHSGLSAAELASAGISESFVRVPVGIEDIDDLIEDFDKALQK